MRRQLQIWGSRTLIVAALLLVGQRWGMPMYKQYFSPKKTSIFVPTAKVQQGTFTVSFHEIGNLEAVKSVPVNSDDDGKLISLVAEGTIVKKGDQIAEMDTSGVKRDVRNQELVVKNADADVARIQEELRMLKLSNQTELDKQQADYDYNVNELKMSEQQRDKKKRLADEKLVPRDQVDQADMDVRSKELAVKKGEKDLDLKKKDIASQEAQKQAEVNKAIFALNIQKSNLEELQSQVKSGVVTAPAAGMVVISKTWAGPGDYRKLQAGDTLHHRQTICQLPDLSSMQATINVGESDAPRVKIGMPVIIRLEAVPGKIFHGTVREISSLATEGNAFDTSSGATPGRKNFEVSVAIKEVDPKVLKPGMTADAEFICESIKSAMSVPIESVIEQDGKTWVYVKNGHKYVKTPVVTGKYNDNFIVITKGLKKDQVVALRDPTRPMDVQEAGAAGPGAEEKKTGNEASPIPGAPATGATKK